MLEVLAEGLVQLVVGAGVAELGDHVAGVGTPQAGDRVEDRGDLALGVAVVLLRDLEPHQRRVAVPADQAAILRPERRLDLPDVGLAA
jgi:hypothetical protein